MPKYYNSTGVKQSVDLTIFPPYEYVETNIFFPTLPVGVTKVSDLPSVNPILLSEQYTAGATIPVPATEGAYIVQIYVESGEWEVQLNVASMSPVLKMTEGMEWCRKFFTRLVDSIILTRTTPAGRIWVQIEKG